MVKVVKCLCCKKHVGLKCSYSTVQSGCPNDCTQQFRFKSKKRKSVLSSLVMLGKLGHLKTV